MVENHYKILGCSQKSSLGEIKVAYGKLLMRYHPDFSADSNKSENEKAFALICEAYSVLTNEKARREYDQAIGEIDVGTASCSNEGNSIMADSEIGDVVRNNLVVLSHYEITNDDGAILSSSDGEGPLESLQGSKTYLPTLAKEVLGKTVGDKFKVIIEVADGYGPVKPELIRVVNRSELAHIPNLKIGMEIGESPNGFGALKIGKIENETVELDGNHRWAGIRLHYQIEIVGLRFPTDDELRLGAVVKGF